jgi:L-histidine N-alpha-methyltransferase
LTIHAPRPSETRLNIVRTGKGSGPDGVREFARAVREGLLGEPRSLPFPYFYDEIGSALFEQICRLPEYYLTRTEDSILARHAGEMVAARETPALVELGSGSAEKTRRLIAAALDRYGSLLYIPVDVSASAVEDSARHLCRLFPALHVSAFVGDYRDCLSEIAQRVRGPKIVVFLGSSLGNYDEPASLALLGMIAGVMGPEDRLLLGTDMAKDRSTLERAYDDSQGVTARFNLNMLHRINRELGADFATERFRHRAVYREDLGRVEMHLESLTEQTVRIPVGDVTVSFRQGERIHTENSCKYTSEALAALARGSGFEAEAVWTDENRWFRVQRWKLSADTDRVSIPTPI